MLTHRNIVGNVLQIENWLSPAFPAHDRAGRNIACLLPLYHIFALTVCMFYGLRNGMHNRLVANPRDLAGAAKELGGEPIHMLPGVNTMFSTLPQHPELLAQFNLKELRISIGGGSAVQQGTADRWQAVTGVPICEGYGLSETSPSATCNPVTVKEFSGTIGVPLPSTYLKLLDDDGQEVTTLGQPGEIAIKGPQVMAGYWQRPDETAKVMTEDGFFKSGDVGVMDERGYFKIVDRKKDMVLVSGFNVYPNEVEEVVAAMPGVMECAVVGVPDEKMGEAVKLVIVRKDPELTEAQVREFCRANLTGYKQPRVIEFREELPKTPVGKILRRELRDKK
jgi:long-chain acyl-CoA synthetase